MGHKWMWNPKWGGLPPEEFLCAVDPLLDLPHGGRTRIRVSVNAQGVAGRFEGGTDPVAARLAGLGRLARAGYPVGLTIAPIMPVRSST